MKIDDTQRVILAAAGARESGLVLPLSKSLKLNLRAATPILATMLESALVSERPVSGGEPVWRTDGDVGNLTLVVTDDGLRAVGIQPETSSAVDGPKSTRRARTGKQQAKTLVSALVLLSKATPSSKAHGETKLGKLAAALRSKKGATIDDMMKATGWQAHSVRGAISGALKKKQGFNILSTITDGRGRVYRIAD